MKGLFNLSLVLQVTFLQGQSEPAGIKVKKEYSSALEIYLDSQPVRKPLANITFKLTINNNKTYDLKTDSAGHCHFPIEEGNYFLKAKVKGYEELVIDKITLKKNGKQTVYFYFQRLH